MKPETLSEARAWDARRDTYAAAGHSDREAARRAWETPKPDADHNEPLAILKMMTKDGDAKLVKDLDCYGCGACRRVACYICEYAKARRKAAGFSAKNFQKNNHRRVPELIMRRITKLARAAASSKELTCQNCHEPFKAKRSTAKWCSPRCRVAGNAA